MTGQVLANFVIMSYANKIRWNTNTQTEANEAKKDVRKRDTLQLDPIMTVWEEGIVFPEYITGKVLY